MESRVRLSVACPAKPGSSVKGTATALVWIGLQVVLRITAPGFDALLMLLCCATPGRLFDWPGLNWSY